ncbi:junctional adhesion molecule A-like [Chiloscyllium punctatum]|uniref:junctional adhesion molecule A-like n=1 Tax=Chiloscyllium punctatum TaxID=137246 RepID=UPI003B632407
MEEGHGDGVRGQVNKMANEKQAGFGDGEANGRKVTWAEEVRCLSAGKDMAVVRPCQNHSVFQLLVLLLLLQQAADLSCLHSPDYGLIPQIDWKLIRTDGSVDVMALDSIPAWPFKNRVEVVPNGLHIRNVFPYDSGTYTCEVTSQYRKRTDRVAIQLRVNAPPSEPFSVTADNPIITTRRRTPADLLCRQSPDIGPNPSIAWVVQKPDGTRRLVSLNGRVIETYQERIQSFPWGLRINVVEMTDSGIYECMVWPQDGIHFDMTEITLNVI